LRRDVRAWLQQVVATRPGTHAISGQVTAGGGGPVAGALVQSGTTHFTSTDANGNYLLPGLINSSRTVTATAAGYTFATQPVTISGTDVGNVNFQSSP
jgi:hypothetical protein